MDTQTVKKHALATGADLVGIASRDRFEHLECSENPIHIMPQMKSVIVLGHQILRGGLRGIETGSTWNAFNIPFSVMVEETYNFCRILESAGWETVPLNNQSTDLRNQGVPVSPDKPAPDIIVDMEFMAYAAGLGNIGKGKLFLTPEYGVRQSFMAVLTTLELEPDPINNNDLCGDCDACLKACPFHAFGPERTAGKETSCGTLKWHPLHTECCRICQTGTVGNPYSTKAEPCRTGAACGRACVAALEPSGKLSRALKNPFRRES